MSNIIRKIINSRLRLNVKTIIYITIVSVIFLHLISSIPSLYRSYEDYEHSERVNFLNGVSDDLYKSVENFGFERGRVNVVLNDAGPIDKMEGNRKFIHERRINGDKSLKNAIAKLNVAHMGSTKEIIDKIINLSNDISDYRKKTDKDLTLSKEQRVIGLSEKWFSIMTQYIESIESLLVLISDDISNADGMISRYSSLKHETLALRNTAGPEMSILSATILSGKPIPPDLAKKIENFQVTIKHHFQNLAFLSLPLTDPIIPNALKELEKIYNENYLPYRNTIFPLALKGGPYPYSQQEFLDKGVNALQQISRFMDCVTEVTKRYAESQLSASKQRIVIQLFSSIGSLVILIIILFFIHLRVIKPITLVTTAVRRLAQKDLTVEVPQKEVDDEIGEMARAVEIFKGMAIQLERDVVSLQIAEEKIRKSEERFRTVADYSYDWEYWIDPKGQLKYMSPSCERISGYTPDEFEKDRNLLSAICLEKDKGTVGDHFKTDYSENDPPTSIDFQLRRKDGEVRWVNHSCQPITDTMGQFLGRRVCNRDITEQKKLETDLIKAKKLEATAILAGGIAHDFNNLLTAAIGNIEIAQKHCPENATAANFLEKAQDALSRAGNLTSKFITFSSGGTPVKNTVDINSFINDSAMVILAGSNVKFSVVLPSESWPVDIDKKQMFQVINNILTNAKESMHDGGSVEVKIENIDKTLKKEKIVLENADYVKILFKDHGYGIPESIIDKIFDPYFSTKEMGHEKGVGLGLTIANSIVNKHGGQIKIEPSKDGHGTTACIYLPKADTINSREHVLPASILENCDHPRLNKLLLMDDEKIVRDYLNEMLTLYGYVCETSIDGDEALKKFTSANNSGNPFDIVIMDLTIPGGMGGVKAVQQVLKIDPTAKVIVASGYSTDPVMNNYADYGFCAAIPKPFKSKELLSTLTRVAAMKR